MNRQPAMAGPRPQRRRREVAAPTIVFLSADDRAGASTGHRRQSGAALAARLARTRQAAFLDASSADALEGMDGLYYVPEETLVGRPLARRLGIAGEDDLFGGVVPFAHMATKAIAHPLVGPDAAAPEGWSAGFAEEVKPCVAFGYTAFARADLEHAARLVAARGRARFKPAAAAGGLGQSLLDVDGDITEALASISDEELERHGVVVEEEIHDATTFAVGRIRLHGLVASYFGTQSQTEDNHGRMVYGGSSLTVARGGFEQLWSLTDDHHVHRALKQARLFDAAANRHFQGFIASRRNYDIVVGLDSAGALRTCVLEQSWRLGGASGAELVAAERLLEHPELAAVEAHCVEVYGPAVPVPADAFVYYRDEDSEVGHLTKYARVEACHHAS
ncbi:hypothetical protein BN1110_04823 [bacterium YEK0313]|nr:hypothetical protein BN1110_04823 [bacterium YEK0313]